MRKILWVNLLCLLCSVPVFAEFIGPTMQTAIVQDYAGNEVTVDQKSGTVYVTAKETPIYDIPDERGMEVYSVVLGTMLTRTGECENGWTQVAYQINGENKAVGYISSIGLTEEYPMEKCKEVYVALYDSDVWDYPGMKDGEVIGEILEMDEVQCTATINDVWCRVVFEDSEGSLKNGYVPLSVFQKEKKQSDEINEAAEAGTLSETEGGGVFTEASEEIEEMEASSLTSLGTFIITHYCPCSLCCGPWADGITSTGVTAVTNRTIAVDPNIIPYGSKVVINGQVYVAEDCGGAIKGKRIDIYVGSHLEGNNKGKYETEVFLITE